MKPKYIILTLLSIAAVAAIIALALAYAPRVTHAEQNAETITPVAEAVPPVQTLLLDAIDKHPYYRTNPVHAEEFENLLRQNLLAVGADTIVDFTHFLGTPLHLFKIDKISDDIYGLAFTAYACFGVPDKDDPNYASIEAYHIDIIAEADRAYVKDLSEGLDYDLHGVILNFANGHTPKAQRPYPSTGIDLGTLVVLPGDITLHPAAPAAPAAPADDTDTGYAPITPSY